MTTRTCQNGKCKDNLNLAISDMHTHFRKWLNKIANRNGRNHQNWTHFDKDMQWTWLFAYLVYLTLFYMDIFYQCLYFFSYKNSSKNVADVFQVNLEVKIILTKLVIPTLISLSVNLNSNAHFRLKSDTKLSKYIDLRQRES